MNTLRKPINKSPMIEKPRKGIPKLDMKSLVYTVLVLSLLLNISFAGLLFFQRKEMQKTTSIDNSDGGLNNLDPNLTDEDKAKIIRVEKIEVALGKYKEINQVVPQNLSDLTADATSIWHLDSSDIENGDGKDYRYCVSSDRRDYEIDISLNKKAEWLVTSDNRDPMFEKGDNPNRYELGTRLDICKN